MKHEIPTYRSSLWHGFTLFINVVVRFFLASSDIALVDPYHNIFVMFCVISCASFERCSLIFCGCEIFESPGDSKVHILFNRGKDTSSRREISDIDSSSRSIERSGNPIVCVLSLSTLVHICFHDYR